MTQTRRGLVLLMVFLAAVLAQSDIGLADDEMSSPTEVEIAAIQHWFEAVVFTHGDHAEMMECVDCHHEGSEDAPGSCADCHQEEFDPGDPLVPSLKLAYHLSCVGCHLEEQAGPTSCLDCHERAALPEGPELRGYQDE